MASNGNYLYGVVPSAGARDFGPIGLDGEDVRIVSEGDLGIITSRGERIPFVEISPERTLQYLAQHQRVLEQVMVASAVIPLKFGTYAEDDGQILEILRCGRKDLAQTLGKYADKVEVDLAAFWADLDSVLAEIARHDGVVALKARIGTAGQATTEQCVRVGQMVKTLLDQRRDQTADQLVAVLRDHWPETIVNPTKDDLMIFNAAILIGRSEQAALGDDLQQLDQRYEGRINFRCIGPLPPYSFATVDIKPLGAAQLDAARPSLGLGQSASLAEIKAVYRQLFQELHPDRNDQPQAADRLKEICAAYELLEEYVTHYKHTFNGAQDGLVIVKVRTVESLRAAGGAVARRDPARRMNCVGAEAA